jgi:SAM-dependent methyltransferase
LRNELREYENQAVKKTLQSTYSPQAIREARARQDAILVERFKGLPVAIADMGCGDGYHGAIFAPCCRVYHGFEISPAIAELARERWRREKLRNVELSVGDVADASPQETFYDLVFCLYFTAGNIRDPSEDLGFYTDAYLDENPRFIGVISKFYRAMKPGGSLFLTVYKDVPEAEAAQRDFYESTGQHVVTPRGLRFVATAEHFWSVRWTERSMLSNLRACGIHDQQVTFHDLNDIAWLVEIKK